MYAYDEMQFTLQKEWNPVFCDKMDANEIAVLGETSHILIDQHMFSLICGS